MPLKRKHTPPAKFSHGERVRINTGYSGVICDMTPPSPADDSPQWGYSIDCDGAGFAMANEDMLELEESESV